MVDTPEEINQALILRLGDMGFEFVEPPNKYCLTAIALGSRSEPKVAVQFWMGKPAAVEISPQRGIAPERLAVYVEALQRCQRLLKALETEPLMEAPGESESAS